MVFGTLVTTENDGFTACGWERMARVERKVTVWAGATLEEGEGMRRCVELRNSREERIGEWSAFRSVNGTGLIGAGEGFKIGVGRSCLWFVDAGNEGKKYGGKKEEDDK